MKPVIIFDLDDTLILQNLATRRTVDLCTAFLKIEPQEFWNVFQLNCDLAFKKLESSAWCEMIGISPQEGLWGNFGGPGVELASLRRQIPLYRFQSWSQTLSVFGFNDEFLANSISKDFAYLRGLKYYTFPGIMDLLSKLSHKYDLSILTNGAPELQWSKVHSSGLEPYFKSVTVSGDYGIGKPKKEIFDILRSKHPQSKDFLMVGDSLSSDIQGARNSGISSVWVKQEDQQLNPACMPDETLDRITDLPQILKKLSF